MTEIVLQSRDGEAGNVPAIESIESSMRPHCLHRDACKARNPGKHCKPCAAVSVTRRSDVIAKRSDTMKAKFQDPEYRERHALWTKEGSVKRLSTPEGAAHLQRLIHIGSAIFNSPEGKRRAHLGLIRKYDPWCPPEFYKLNQKMKKRGFSETERREIILVEVPGTPEHASRAVANARLAGRIKHQREVAGRY